MCSFVGRPVKWWACFDAGFDKTHWKQSSEMMNYKFDGSFSQKQCEKNQWISVFFPLHSKFDARNFYNNLFFLLSVSFKQPQTLNVDNRNVFNVKHTTLTFNILEYGAEYRYSVGLSRLDGASFECITFVNFYWSFEINNIKNVNRLNVNGERAEVETEI